MDISIRGVDAVEKAARIVKDIEPTQRKVLLAAIRKPMKNTVRKMKDNAGDKLPQAGGFADEVRTTKIGVRTRTQGKSAGVRLHAKLPGRDLRNIDRGRLRHPVFGNRSNWVTQSVVPRTFSEPFEDSRDEVQLEILRGMQDVVDTIAGRSS